MFTLPPLRKTAQMRNSRTSRGYAFRELIYSFIPPYNPHWVAIAWAIPLKVFERTFEP